MARANSSSSRPAWLRHPLAKFFASLKLAVVLLAVLIVAAIIGTICESSFDAKVARAYIYGAPWFNFWLLLLGANLAVSALSRLPWKKHHTAFLVTHLGIITLLIGSLIGRIWGIEGTMMLFKNEPPASRLLMDEHQLRVHDIDGIIKGYPAEFLHHPPSPNKPLNLGALASGAKLSIIDYASAIDGKLNPKPLSEGGAPALHFKIQTAMMGQNLESWLLAGDPEHASFSMGLANIELKRGVATSKVDSPRRLNEDVDLAESIFAFSKAPEEQIGRVVKGGSTGAKVRLVENRVVVSLGGSESSFDVKENLGKEAKIDNSPFTLKIDNYWPDFRMENGKPVSLGNEPNNPAVLVTISGKGTPVAPNNPHGKEMPTNGGPPTMPGPGEAALNHLMFFIADDGAITYELKSRKNGDSSGKIDIDQPLTTGWADWQLKIDKVMPHAVPSMDFTPLPNESGKDLPDGVRIRVEQNSNVFEQWIPSGWQMSVPTLPNETKIGFGFRTIALPIGLELLDFEVTRNEGSDSPAGFKSNLRVATAEGANATGSCWMNHPFSFPGDMLHTWTGFTYKISQASWNPEDLNQSSVQILRDPGWLFKWIGSLLIVTGVFMMFYLRPYRKQTAGEPITPALTKDRHRHVEKNWNCHRALIKRMRRRKTAGAS